MNTKDQARDDFAQLYGETYWDRLVRLGKDPHSRLFRTDHPSRSKTIYNLMIWKPSDPFLRIEVKTESMMEVETWA